jgi:DNA-binding CsgD family transcriptional regulator
MSLLSNVADLVPQEILEPLCDKSIDIVYLLDVLKDKYLYVSPTQEVLGYGCDVFYEKGSDFTISLINPEDHQRVILHFAAILENSSLQERVIARSIQFRMQHASGTWVWVKRTAISYTKNGTYYVLGLVEDCSKEMDKEKFILDSIQQKPSLLKNLSNALEISKDKYTKDEQFRLFKSITKREIDILKLLAEGLSSKMIAAKLNIATGTVEEHRKRLHKKFLVHNSAGLIIQASKNGFLEISL